MKIEDLEGVGAGLRCQASRRGRPDHGRSPRPGRARGRPQGARDEHRDQSRPAPALDEPRRPVPDLGNRLRVCRPARGERGRLVPGAGAAERGEPRHHDGRGQRGPFAGPATPDRGDRERLDRAGEGASEGRHALTAGPCPAGIAPAASAAAPATAAEPAVTCGRASSCASCPCPCRPSRRRRPGREPRRQSAMQGRDRCGAVAARTLRPEGAATAEPISSSPHIMSSRPWSRTSPMGSRR